MKEREKIRKCYEKGLVANPGLSGRLVFQWTILANGTVSNTRLIKSDFASEKREPTEAFEKCFSEVISGVQFPQAENGRSTTVIYPFAFNFKGKL